MNSEITRLSREYTQETANLKDYQCQAKSAIYGRQMAKNILRKIEKDGYDPYYNCDYSCAADIAKDNRIEIEQGDPADSAEYIWALVPEYNSHKQAKVVLRRVGTADGELLLSPDERDGKRLEMTGREKLAWRAKTLRSIIDKIKNYESQIKNERGRLKEQIKNYDKAYMEACAIQLKRICDNMNEDLDDFLDSLLQ